MNITREWLESNGIDPGTLDALLSPAPPVALALTPRGEPRHQPQSSGRRPRHAVNDLGQNKSEAAFAEHLDRLKTTGRIADWAWEPFRVTLASRCHLRIDFVVKRLDKSLCLIDVKGGHIEDDAIVKLKVAAEKYAWLGEVWIAQREKSSWLFRRVGRGGIARDPVGSIERAAG